MSRSLASSSRVFASTVVCLAVLASPAFAQVAVGPIAVPLSGTTAAVAGELAGLVLDDRGQPLAGAVVSALGGSSTFVVSDKEGRYLFRSLPPGAYLLRAHLQGYQPGRVRVMQIASAAKGASTITLTRLEGPGSSTVLAAGVGATPTIADAPEDGAPHEHGELAWRLRHLKRSVLKDAAVAIPGFDQASPPATASPWREPRAGLGRAVDGPARVASALFPDLGLDGQVDLLTTASFDHPQDLLRLERSMPRGVALMSLETSGPNGRWRMRGALTQGDLSSWLVHGAYVRTAPSAHQYEAGFSYGLQRYLGESAATLASLPHDSRSVATLYASDTWTPLRAVSVGYGAEYATHDYLGDDALLSPSAGLEVRPFPGDSFSVRTTASRRETAPGAEEFAPPSAGIWMPPERTFSAVSTSGAIRPQRTDTIEVAVDRTTVGHVRIGARVFRQRGEDQIAAFFGDPSSGAASAGHYYVGSAGDFDARGWGLRVGRAVGDAVRASVDYSQAWSTWSTRAADRGPLAGVAATAIREADRIHDVTATVESRWAPTSTRVFVLYKVNTALGAVDREADAEPVLMGTRFDVQVSQGLPFLRFPNTEWEALVAVRNMFYGDVVNGSVYDELLVVRSPTRVLGGVTVKF